MVGTMGQLPKDRRNRPVFLPTDLDLGGKVFRTQGAQVVKETLPGLFPMADHFGFGGRGFQEFGIPVTPGLFTVLGQKMGPSAEHIARQMFGENGNGIVGLPGPPMDGLVTELRKGFVPQGFVPLELKGHRLEKSTFNCHWDTYSAGSKPRLTELMQYLCPVVSRGPSSKTWPKCPPQLAQRVSVRIMPWELSLTYSIAPSTALSKEGHPQLLSNLCTLSKRRALQAAQW